MGRDRQQYGSGGRNSPNIDKPTPQELKTIVQGGLVESAELTVKWASSLGKSLVNAKLTTSQIRGIFGQVRRIEMNWTPGDDRYAAEANRDLLLLKPKLKYQAGRAKGGGVGELADVLTPAIDLVQGNRENFQRFVDFFEAILAYHKAEGGE